MNLSLTGAFSRLKQAGYKTFSKKPGENEVLVPVSCPICHSRSVRPHWNCETFVFSCCLRCKHLYQNPMPKSQDLLDRYDEEYKSYEVENSENFFTLMRYGLRDAGFFSIEKTLQGEKRALDLGCATGVLVRYLQNRGWNSEGLEVCRPAAEYGMEKRGVKIHIGTIEEAALDAESYNLVHFSHVIEHLPDINSFLAEVRRITQKGGYVIITTPNRRSFQAMLMKDRWRSAIADHTHLFNARELAILLKRHGFSPQRWKTWGGIPVGMAPGWLKRIADRIARVTNLGDVIMVIARRIS